MILASGLPFPFRLFGYFSGEVLSFLNLLFFIFVIPVLSQTTNIQTSYTIVESFE